MVAVFLLFSCLHYGISAVIAASNKQCPRSSTSNISYINTIIVVFIQLSLYNRSIPKGKGYRTTEINIMMTAQNILYSVSAARRILGIYYPEIKVQIQVWKKVIWVWVEGRRPTLISKSKFRQQFIEWRQLQSRDVAISRHPRLRHTFIVQNPKSNSTYEVVASSDRVHCQCEDYRNQVKFFGNGCCKHGYTTLNYLGYSTLREYLSCQSAMVH